MDKPKLCALGESAVWKRDLRMQSLRPLDERETMGFLWGAGMAERPRSKRVKQFP